MNAPNDGGPAFPVYIPDERDPSTGCGIRQGMKDPGMSLRDWFAGMMLSGMAAGSYSVGVPEKYAETAYAHADAMLSARNKEKP